MDRDGVSHRRRDRRDTAARDRLPSLLGREMLNLERRSAGGVGPASRSGRTPSPTPISRGYRPTASKPKSASPARSSSSVWGRQCRDSPIRMAATIGAATRWRGNTSTSPARTRLHWPALPAIRGRSNVSIRTTCAANAGSRLSAATGFPGTCAPPPCRVGYGAGSSRWWDRLGTRGAAATSTVSAARGSGRDQA